MTDKRRLDYHLQPSENPDGILPSVIDSEGSVVRYTGARRITDETTVVDIGTSPNANDGDPLRTAFIKLNNFMEASYHLSHEINDQMIEQELRGPFLGQLSAAEFPAFSAFNDQRITNGGDWRENIFKIAILNETLSATSRSTLNSAFTNVALDDTTNIPETNGRFFIRKGSILLYIFGATEAQNQVQVVWQSVSDEITFDYFDAFARLATGTQDSSVSTSEQIELADRLNELARQTGRSHSVGARNVEDALVEMYARFNRRGLDAGYYG